MSTWLRWWAGRFWRWWYAVPTSPCPPHKWVWQDGEPGGRQLHCERCGKWAGHNHEEGW